MYNVTPHGTTGKSPSKLLFGRNIRDKISSIGDLIGEEKDEETADNDRLHKYKEKEKEDKTRGAKETDINSGDLVVIQNMVVTYVNSKIRQYGIQRDGREGKRIIAK